LNAIKESTSINEEEEEEEGNQPNIVANEDEPVANIQVRMAEGGKRAKIKINFSSTIRDLHAMIDLETGGGGPSYVLMGGYPPHPITNMRQTIQEAELDGTQVTQRYC